MTKQQQTTFDNEANPFNVWDELMDELKTVSPFDLEARIAIARKIENERAVLKSCGFDPANRTYCADCY